MKNIIRFLALSLVILMTFSACQGAGPEIVPEYIADTDLENLDGMIVKWGFSISRYVEDTDNVFGYIPGSAFADTALERKKSIENEYNCTIEVDNDSSSNVIFNRLNGSLASGSRLYDIVTCDSSVLAPAARAGYLIGLSSYLDISNTDKYGTPNMLQSVFWKTDLYGVLPFAWPELVYSTSGYPITVNEDLIRKLGQTDPREYVENGTWTWDTFEECLHAYTHEDNGRTVYALSTHAPYFAMMMFLSNGVSFSEYQNGEVICGAYTDAGFEALERARSIYRETCKDCIHPSDPNLTGKGDFIVNGDVVMYVTGNGGILGDTDSLMYRMENVGILPFPQGPNATPGVYTSYYEQFKFTTSIPINALDFEVSALVLDAMYEPFEGYETKDDIANYMAEQIFFDKRDAEVLINMLENAEYGFFWEGARTAIDNTVTGSDTIAAILESYETTYETIAEKYMTPHYEGRLAVFGE